MIVAAVVTLILSILTSTPTEAAQNEFPVGQCTWYAALVRPDLIGSVYGDARDWTREAANSGVPVGQWPAVGAVAVLQPGVQGADGYGHVAIVRRVGGGGWFEVSQRNWLPWPWQVSYSWFHTGWGVSFIYR